MRRPYLNESNSKSDRGLLAAVCLIVMLFSAKTFAQDGVHSEVDITS